MSTLVKLTTSDGKEVSVERDVIIRSKLIAGLLEDTNDSDTAIPLMNVKEETLNKVIEYCEYHRGDPLEYEEEEDPTKKAKSIEDIDPWDFTYCKIDKENLYDLILAANYLDIKPLIAVCCKMVANMIRGKNVAQIREEFGIVNDFTPEEERDIRKENSWIENR